jgi:spermidine synthase
MPAARRPAASPTLAWLLLASTLVIAACGLAYELTAGALASYLVGDTITLFSTVIGTYLCAMGVGAWLSQFVRRDLAARFVALEILVGLCGGFSAAALFAAFASNLAFHVVLYALVAVVGVLVGMEIPLMLRILRRRLAFEALVARVLSADYLGALAASLVFPLWFVPRLGLIRGALVFGIVNLLVALLTLWLFRRELRGRGLWAAAGAALALLGAGLAYAEQFARRTEQQLYPDPVILARQSPYQRIVVTHDGAATRLYLNHHLQFDSTDEHRYHEALVHPALAALAAPRRALVLGGGDGLAVRELLRYPGLERITLVDLDAAVTALFRDHPALARLNGGALADARVTVVNDDAWRWLDANDGVYDAIVVDLPDPSNFALGRLYSSAFYRLLKRRLAPHGRLVVQATSPLFAREAYWCVVATLEAAGLATVPYHAYVPSFGEWGFVLAGHAPYAPPRDLPAGLRFLAPATLPTLFVFSPDMARVPVEPNRLDTQVLVQYYERAWRAAPGG